MSTPIYERPTDLLRTLIRFDTTNPPGNEAECIGYLDGLLQEGGSYDNLAGERSEWAGPIW